MTLPLLTGESPKVETLRCKYTEMPTKTEHPVTEETVTFIAGCSVFAGPGGIQNHDLSNCTPIPSCSTYAVFMSDTSVSLGSSINEDDGAELGKAVVDGVEENCPDDGEKCNNEPFELFDVPVIIKEGVEYMVLEATIEDSVYNSSSTRDHMLYSITSGLITATNKSCTEVSYEQASEAGESGCGDGSLEKRNPPPPIGVWDSNTGERSLEKRISPSDPDGYEPLTCTYSADMCGGPRVTRGVFGTISNPFKYNVMISLRLVAKDEGLSNPIAQWFCETAVNGLALVAMRYMPKLPGYEGVSYIEDLALETICRSPKQGGYQALPPCVRDGEGYYNG